MTTPAQNLTNKIATLSTPALVQVSRRMTLAFTNEEIIVGTYGERQLEPRLPEAEFLAHMGAVEALLDLAA